MGLISVFDELAFPGEAGSTRTAGMGAGAVTRGLGAAGAGVAARAAGALEAVHVHGHAAGV
ncbi:MAG TPA: hypothetical protein PK490_05770, partial [Prosthecobacter sp.]|nr:hypothetical protein [Prosthecobacter sp.]